MKRLLTVALPLILTAAVFAATPGAATTVLPQGELSVMDGPSPGTTSAGCCWIYLFGRWWCVPCG